jgi:Ca-activated chloride channel family protein
MAEVAEAPDNQERKHIAMTRRIVVKSLCLAILLSVLATSMNAASARKLVREGNRAYKAGQFDQALAKYKAALMEGGDPGVVAYNLGNAHYNLGESQAAQEAYTQSLRPAKAGDLAASLYNLGNAYFQAQKYSGAISAYIEALKRSPNDENAKYNLELARRALKQAQQNQQQQDQNDKDQKDKQDSQQNQQQQQQQDQQPNQNQENEQKPQQDQKQQQQQEQQTQPQQQKQMSPEEAERILNSLLQNEQNALKQAKKMQVVARPKREKDW